MVDTARTAADPFKLSTALQTVVAARLADAKGKNAGTSVNEGATIGATGQRQQALDRLADLERNGYSFIASVLVDDLTEAQRAQVFASYGWEGGVIGDLSAASRVEHLANPVAVDATVPAAGKYPASLVARTANWLAIYDAANVLATGGSQAALIAQRNAARDLLEAAVSRVRHFYCQAGDDGDQTPELAKIGMQARRNPGDAQPQPLPEVPGTAVFDAATRELTVPAVPAHASFLRSFRKVRGGVAESAGVSNTVTVSVVGLAPLAPGATYELWVVGENSRGKGPESNRVSFTA